MKKYSSLFLLLIVLLSAVLLAACSQSIEENFFGNIAFNMDSASSAKTIEPEYNKIVCAEYVAYGEHELYQTKQDNAYKFEKSFTEKQTSVEKLIAGKWTIWVEGKNEDGSVIAKSEEQEVTVVVNQTATADTFVLDYITEGQGNLDLTVKAPVESGAVSVDISIGEITENVSTYKDESTERIFSFTTELDIGEYSIKVVMKDAAGNTIGCPNIEVAHVFNGLISSKTWENALAAAKPEITVNGTEVTITTATQNDGTIILYTTDGTSPAKSSTAIKYNGPFNVGENVTITAVTVHPDMYASEKAVKNVVYQLPAPKFSKDSGRYYNTLSITLSAQSGSTIYYTTDGTTPTDASDVYSSAIAVNESKTIKALARLTGCDDSNVSTAVYNLYCASPALAKDDTAKTVSLSTSTTDATIYYTMDGSDPTTASTKYVSPIDVPSTGETTLKAKAFRTGFADSDVSSWKLSIDTGSGKIIVEEPKHHTLTISAPESLLRTKMVSRADGSVTFEAKLTGTTPTDVSYQWFINNYKVDGAVNDTFTLGLSKTSLGKNRISVEVKAEGKTYYESLEFTVIDDYTGINNELYGFWKTTVNISGNKISLGMMLYPYSKNNYSGYVAAVMLNDQGIWSNDNRNSGTYNYWKENNVAKIKFTTASPGNTQYYTESHYILDNVTLPTSKTMHADKLTISAADGSSQDIIIENVTFDLALSNIGKGIDDRDFWTGLTHFNMTTDGNNIHLHKYTAVSGEYEFSRVGLSRHAEEKSIVGIDKWWYCDFCGERFLNRKTPGSQSMVTSLNQLWNIYGAWVFTVPGTTETDCLFFYPEEDTSRNGELIAYELNESAEEKVFWGISTTYTISGTSGTDLVVSFNLTNDQGTNQYSMKNIVYKDSGSITFDLYKNGENAGNTSATRKSRFIGSDPEDNTKFDSTGCMKGADNVHRTIFYYRNTISFGSGSGKCAYVNTSKKLSGLHWECRYCGQALNEDGTEIDPVTTSTDFVYIDDGKTVVGLLKSLKGTKSKIIIPDGVTKINESAFAADGYISEVYIPASVTTIGNRAFRNCDITKLEFEERQSQNELVIEDRAFFANNLTNINLPEGVKSIGVRTFKRADSLSSNEYEIYLPSTLESIGRYAFGSFGSVNFSFGGSVAGWDKVKKELSWNAWCEDGTIKCSDGDAYVYEYYILNGTNDDLLFGKITDACRNHKEDKFLEVDSSAIGIGELAFVDGSNLNSILFHSSVTSIGEKVFNGAGSPNVYYNGTLAQFRAISVHSDWKGNGDPALVVCQDDGKLMGLWKGRLVDTSGADCGEYILAIGRVLSFSESGASLGDGKLLIKTNVLSDGVALNPGFDYASSAASVVSKEGGYSATIKSMAMGQGQTADMPVSISSDANTMTIDKTVVSTLLSGSYQDLVLTRQ